MNVHDLPFAQLSSAPWNPNRMSAVTLQKLRTSVGRFGLVARLVVRPVADGFEVLSGNQRFQVLQQMGVATAPCVIVTVDDTHARLLAQALNRLAGEDDPGLKAELIQQVLVELSADEVISVLPETAESLRSMASLGQETIAARLQAWQAAQSARLRHFQAQLTDAQLDVVNEVMERFLPQAKETRGGNPNARGRALYLLCKWFLEEGPRV